jgi:hypothetical protein
MEKIAPAFVKAKREFGPALKDKANPAFRSKYADLGACIDAVEDALLANGIAFFQETFEDATGVTVETVFMHESGETMRCGRLHVPAAKQDPQGYGSALTYARRYSLMAACGIAPEDDDGNAAKKAKDAADAKRVLERANWLETWLNHIDEAGNVGELKAVMEQCIAEARAEKDGDAEGQFLAAKATKIAKAKKEPA